MNTSSNMDRARIGLRDLVLASFLLALMVIPSQAADKLPAGSAKGTFGFKDQAPVAITFSAVLVDEKDDRKPVLLILSDKKLPTEDWVSEFDLIRQSNKLAFTGVVFFMNNDGEVFRTDVYRQGRQSSVSGFFKLKLDAKPTKKISGHAALKEGDEDKFKLDVAFHAALK